VRIPFRLVDVFTDRPLAGNQLCVVPEPLGLETEVMQAIAQEIGFSETTFITSIGAARYGLRIFTPTDEMPFAGHPTLGTAFVMVSEGRVTSPLIQEVAAGEVPVEVTVGGLERSSGFARMRQLAPSFGPNVEDRPALAASLGLEVGDLHPRLPPQVVSTGFPELMVPVASDEAVVRAAPVAREMLEVLEPLGTDGCYVAYADGSNAHARFLWPVSAMVREDAATGAAVGSLGAYLAERGALKGGRLTVRQGVEMGRPSTLVVDVVKDSGRWVVHVGGGVVRVGSGEFQLPL
jgi:trans-2,3-dihydro-3-hydroxyanthranilate isomerase